MGLTLIQDFIHIRTCAMKSRSACRFLAWLTCGKGCRFAKNWSKRVTEAEAEVFALNL